LVAIYTSGNNLQVISLEWFRGGWKFVLKHCYVWGHYRFGQIVDI